MSGSDPLPRPRRVRRGAALTLVFAGVLVTGAATGSFEGPTERGRTPVGRHGEDEVVQAATRALAKGTSAADAARRAVSRSGDRWGAVYSEGDYAAYEQSLDGEYTGVGLWVRRDERGRTEIVRVQPGAPADRAGIRAGDLLTDIDGRRLTGLPVTEVVARLRGDDARGGDAADTAVALGLRRAAHAWHRTLHRATLTNPSVSVTRLGDSAHATVVVEVSAFTKGSGQRVRDAVRAAPAGAGILLDLRGNSGGLVTEATEAASAFLDGGLVATYDIKGVQHALHAKPGGDTTRPLVTLVDGGTMSAAELLTGALQDRGRAVVVGARTFGKGSVQMPSPLPDGSVAELTVGHYRTPSGRTLDGRGITPDLEATDHARTQAQTVLSGL
ncbi:S41 family peptidase [Streptomyces sp. NPDC050560]|uniref:S41 family peptidase n=1 Tax=Streptomyces sp. NPDC050560 TaxID=3365630 RepID=UPI0037B1227E